MSSGLFDSCLSRVEALGIEQPIAASATTGRMTRFTERGSDQEPKKYLNPKMTANTASAAIISTVRI